MLSKGRVEAFDLDGTLLAANCSLSFCRFLLKHKILSRREFLFCARSYAQYRLGLKSLSALQTTVFNRLFLGKKIAHIEPYLEPFIEKMCSHLYLPAFWRKKKAQNSVLLSSSPSFLVAPIAKRLGFIEWVASEYTIDHDGVLCGISHLVDGCFKANYIKRFQEVAAFSDSIDDLPFLEAATHPVAVRPKKGLLAVAKKRGWEIL